AANTRRWASADRRVPSRPLSTIDAAVFDRPASLATSARVARRRLMLPPVAWPAPTGHWVNDATRGRFALQAVGVVLPPVSRSLPTRALTVPLAARMLLLNQFS